MPTVNLGGVEIFYSESGRGDPVLLVHGIPTDYRAWNEQMKEIPKTRRAIAVSRRYASPNGRKGDLSDSTVENNAADMKSLIEKLGLAPVHLVGHSYGGFIAAVLAADHPDLVRSLVLVEPAISTMLVTDEKSPAQMLSLLLRIPSVALSARKFQSNALYSSLKALEGGRLDEATRLMVDGVQDRKGAFEALDAGLRSMMLENGRTIGELKTEFPRFTKAEAGRIGCKTLVMNGERSPLWLRRIGRLLAETISGCEYSSVPGAAHFPHVERPAEFNARLLKFLSEN